MVGDDGLMLRNPSYLVRFIPHLPVRKALDE